MREEPAQPDRSPSFATASSTPPELLGRPQRPPTPAEEAFASFLERVDSGQETSFDEYCSGRPELRGELVELHEHWRGVQSVVARLGLQPSRPALARPGARPVEAAAPGASDADGGAPQLFGRLRARRRALEGEPRYVSEGELTRGGMGAIWEVWDEDLRRPLAMKVALGSGPGARSLDRRAIGRFLEEAQITGQLDHPGIVPVHELGVDEHDRLFFTMRLVHGDHLGEVFRKARVGEEGWSRTRVLGLLLRVCEATAYAHQKGVVHRDLKPANVMVGRFGEAYVMDWGLARVLDRAQTKDVRRAGEATGSGPPDPSRAPVRTDRQQASRQTPDSPLLTVDGDVVGTPCYMAPEQARGSLGELGPATDVYSVGAMLYELLAGRAPYVPADGSSLAPGVVWHRVLAGPPEPLAQLASDVPPELIAICERAMARQASERYPDMGAMAEDLRAFLENRVVRAHRTGALVELRKWVARNRAAAALLTALLVVLLGAIATVAWTERRRSEGIRRYSDIAFAQELVADFDERGPIDAAHARERELWLSRADALAARRLRYEEELARLRSRALPPDPEETERLRREHPFAQRVVEIESLRKGWRERRATIEAQLADPALELDAIEKLQRDVATFELEVPAREAQLASMQRTLAELRPWRFASEDDALLHARLARLDGLLQRLFDQDGLRQSVVRELQLGSELARRSLDEHAEEWAAAQRAIEASPRYGGLRLAPQLGLVPLGEDPQSGLWEFWHVLSGERPAPGAGDGARWSVGAETGLVLVLVPGGRATIGAQREDPEAPRYDPDAHPNEAPPSAVELAPWFLSKYEMTQGQWLRLSGENPSTYPAGSHYLGIGVITRAHPVEKVSDLSALARWGLVVPTEAQWETAARGGTDTPYWFGERFEDGGFLVNHADLSGRLAGLTPASAVDDGFPLTAPVDGSLANGFGLVGVSGNVAEWCLGPFPDSYHGVAFEGPEGRSQSDRLQPGRRSARGGSFVSPPRDLRVSSRTPLEIGDQSVGVRPARSIEP